MLALTGDFEKSARMSGISGRTLRRWAANAAGPQQRTCGAKFEPYGDEVRGKAMEMARKGASCRGIAEALGIGSPDVVRYWLKGGGTKGARMSGRARTPEGDEPAYAGFEGGLEERIRQLELENDILRGVVDLLKAGSLGSMSNMEKTVLINKLRLESDRPLRELTDSLRISKSSYEYCRAKLRAKDKHAQLRIDIRRIFDGAGGTRGYRYVHNELREGGVVVSEKVVRRLMAEEGCKVAYLKRKRRYNSYKGEISDAPPNLVRRNFHADAPNKLWLTDITVFGNGFLDTLAARFRQSGKRTADASDFCLPEHQGLVHPLARAVELDESSMVDHPVDHRGGKLVVAQDRSPFAELDVGGEHHASLLVAC